MTPQQKYYRKNKEKLLEKAREKYRQNIEEERRRSKEYKANNKDSVRAYYCGRYQKLSRDPAFKIRDNVSRQIRRSLTQVGKSKNGISFLKRLNYTMVELKQHLESQFESWMTWDNYGVYNSKTWDDNDPTTWTWQLDHIVPQSTLKYFSMNDDNFVKCWSLNNLRPLSSKKNYLDGNSRIRHKGKK